MLTTLEPTKKYFLTMFSVSCALLVVFTCVIYRQSEILQDRGKALVNSYELLKNSRDMLIDALNMETGQRGYLLSGSKQFLEPYYANLTLLNSDLDKLQALVSSGKEQDQNLEGLRKKIEIYKGILEGHIHRSDKRGHKLTVSDLIESKAAMDSVRAALDGIIGAERVVLQRHELEVDEQQRHYQYTLFMGAALGVGALVIANILMYSLLARTRETEEELKKSQERISLVMSGVNDGIYDINLRDKSIYFSQSSMRMLGYSDAEFPDTLDKFIELLHPDDKENAISNFVRYAKRDVHQYFNEFRLRHKDGSWRWIMSRGIGMWDEAWFMYRLVGSHTDITAQRQREDELKQLNSDMEGFTYIASHDLRAPLVNLRGFASEVRHALNESLPAINHAKATMSDADKKIIEMTFNKEIPESLGFIDAAVARMDKLTSAILDMSRIGRREYRFEEVDANSVVERCLFTLAHEINVKNINVVTKPLPIVITDLLAMEQVFGNLLDNAVKYLAPSRAGEIIISARTSFEEVIFSISDNGRGIAETDQRKVFEIFRRAGNSGDVRGSGMGMAYVKATLRKLGGRIWFDSKLNQGTTFYFTLPIITLKDKI